MGRAKNSRRGKVSRGVREINVSASANQTLPPSPREVEEKKACIERHLPNSIAGWAGEKTTFTEVNRVKTEKKKRGRQGLLKEIKLSGLQKDERKTR